jgi:hypothetical protein
MSDAGSDPVPVAADFDERAEELRRLGADVIGSITAAQERAQRVMAYLFVMGLTGGAAGALGASSALNSQDIDVAWWMYVPFLVVEVWAARRIARHANDRSAPSPSLGNRIDAMHPNRLVMATVIVSIVSVVATTAIGIVALLLR